MAINPALLVAAPILQDYFSDNATDAAMSNGVITCFQDGSRTTLKNWYYQSGVPGAYTYVPLNNPLTLSAAGTITDPNGNDTIPFFYPYSESDNSSPQPYYITCVNSNGQTQFTRQNFPFVTGTNTIIGNGTNRNLVINNVFWRNIGSATMSSTATVIAPSQHDGFSSTMSDIQFIRSDNSATDVISFNKFASPLNATQPTPEYYLNVNCTSNSSTETYKYIQIPICLHVANLSQYANAVASIWAQNIGASNNQITISLWPFLGTGTSSPFPNPLQTFTLNSNWTQVTQTLSFPAQTLPGGAPGDDAWYLLIGFKTGVSFNINIALPAIYLNKAVPANDFQTYEFASESIDSPRTGDIRTSLNTYQPYGWVTMNDGTIGNASSNATARKNIDTWPLYSLIWNSFASYDSGGVNPICQMFTSGGTPTGYGGTAIADFNNNKALALTKMMGRLLLGDSSTVIPSFTRVITASSSTPSGTSSALILINSSNPISTWNGAPIIFSNTGGSLPANISAGVLYYVGGLNVSGSNTFYISTTFANSILISERIATGGDCASIAVNFSSTGSGTNKFSIAPAGSFAGENQHTQLVGELAQHQHSIGISVGTGVNTATVGNNGQTNTGTQTQNTNSTGNSTPFNLMQPFTLMNFYMKL